ncbi:MAG: putative outer membrane protein [Chthoniobacteraceae bacterium]|nr:putative outer membrane protein [Chthoniobacteraceae bacterium]
MNAYLFRSIFVAASLSFSLVVRATAADDSQNAGISSGKLAIADEAFVLKAAQDGLTEVQLGDLAGKKGNRDDVKKFASAMTTDHGKINDALKAFALQKGVTLPVQLDAVHAGVIDRLSKLEKEQFDKAYIERMIADHKADVGEFSAMLTKTADADLKLFLKSTLPILKAHLSHIERIETGR